MLYKGKGIIWVNFFLLTSACPLFSRKKARLKAFDLVSSLRPSRDPFEFRAGLKLWSEPIAINVGTIRKIRGLDDRTQTAAITIANPRSFSQWRG